MPTASRPSTHRSTTLSRRTLNRSNSYFYKESQSTSLFDSLPLELHIEVFSYCLPAYPSITHDESPMHIARVCRTWRSLVNSTPRLWSSFEIKVQDCGSDESLSESPFALKLMRIQYWLKQSKNQPLSLRLIHIPTGRIPSELSAHLLALFATEAKRWRRIEFVVPSTSLSAVQHLFPEEFPALRSLKLHMSGGGWTLPGSSFDMHTHFQVPWNQLIELDLRLDHHHLLDLDDYASALVGASNLTVCRVNARCALLNQPDGQTRERLELPSLRSLHLILQGGDIGDPLSPPPPSGYLSPEASLTTFLGLFGGCGLSHLGINWLLDGDRTEQWATDAQPAFLDFVKTQASSLRSLELTYLSLGGAAVLECLAQLSLVEELDVRFSLADQRRDPVSDSVLHALALSSPPPIQQQSAAAATSGSAQKQSASEKNGLLPRLQSLHLQCTGAHCTQEALVNFLLSRTQDLPRISSSARSLSRFRFYSMQQVITDRAQQQRVRALLDAEIDSVVLL